MWPGGELPVCRSGQQETRVWWGGGQQWDSGHAGGQAVLEICAYWPLGLGSGGQELAQSARRDSARLGRGGGQQGREDLGRQPGGGEPSKMEGGLRVWERVGL